MPEAYQRRPAKTGDCAVTTPETMDAGWAVVAEQRLQIGDRGPDVRLGSVVVPFHGHEHLGRVGTRRALGRLPPAPAPRAHEAGVVDEDDLALGGVSRSPEPRSVNDSVPAAKRTVVPPVTVRWSNIATGRP